MLVLVSALLVLTNVQRGNDQPGILGSQLFDDNSGPLDVSSIAARVTPAVVDITASFPEGLVAGTGMVITAGGEVLTNNHVVESASDIRAQVGGTGATYPARVIGTDPGADVALLQLEGASGLSTINVGGSTKVGDGVVAIGNALGREGPPSASQGQVTAVGQTVTATDDSGANRETLTDLIEVNADVVPGDSGGPLVDSAGRVVGMDTAASARRFRFRTGTSEGFAIPIATAMSVAQQLRNGGGSSGSSSAPQARTALLGVQLGDDGGAGGNGAYVVGVQPGSPADEAGISGGDVIVSIDGSTVESAAGLRDAIHAHRPGDRVVVGWVDASGQQSSATVRLAAATG